VRRLANPCGIGEPGKAGKTTAGGRNSGQSVAPDTMQAARAQARGSVTGKGWHGAHAQAGGLLKLAGSQKLGRSYLGIELDMRYHALASHRLEQVAAGVAPPRAA